MAQPLLFEPFSIKDLILKNRIVMAPMCMYSSSGDGMVRPFHTGHYMSRALGGASLIIQEATAVLPDGRISDRDLGIWSDDHIPGLRDLVDLIHQSGSKTAIQLAHSGRKCTVPQVTPAGPSPISFDDKSKTPEELAPDAIEGIIQAFAQAAARAATAGYDAIEVHAAHGYLIHEFLSPISNIRKDMWGNDESDKNSREYGRGRSLLLTRILKAVRDVWPEGRPVWVRISASDYFEGGLTPPDLVEIIKPLADLIDAVHVSSGGLLPILPPSNPGYQVPFSEVIRKGTSLPTFAVGLIDSPAQAEEILKNKKADIIALGRELLRNPQWPCYAAKILGAPIPYAEQYRRAWI